MITKGNKSIVGIYYKNKPILNVYERSRLVWSSMLALIASCFYQGYWIDENPWTDDTSWEQ